MQSNSKDKNTPEIHISTKKDEKNGNLRVAIMVLELTQNIKNKYSRYLKDYTHEKNTLEPV